jgi:hypothetical protein
MNVAQLLSPRARYRYRIGLPERLRIGTPYPAVTARIVDLMRQMPEGTEQVVDRTGAHGPCDELVAANLSPLGLTITSGADVHWQGRCVSVPKQVLVTTLVSVAQGGDLSTHSQLTDWPELRRQLQNFKAIITPSGKESWAASSGHDDLVITAAMAVWVLKGSATTSRKQGGIYSWGIYS